MTARILLALSLLAGLLMLAAVGVGMREHELERLREQRFHTLIGELREKFETDLHIGLELSDISRAQGLLEDAAARMPQVVSIDVVDERGVSLFSSDRGLRGQPTPRAWADAARREPAAWRVTRQDEQSLGLPLRDAFGQRVGQLVLTHQLGDPSRAWRGLLLPSLTVACGIAVAALLMLSLTDRFALRRLRADLARLDAPHGPPVGQPDLPFPADELAWRLASVRAALDEADREARRIAGTDA